MYKLFKYLNSDTSGNIKISMLYWPHGANLVTWIEFTHNHSVCAEYRNKFAAKKMTCSCGVLVVLYLFKTHFYILDILFLL